MLSARAGAAQEIELVPGSVGARPESLALSSDGRLVAFSRESADALVTLYDRWSGSEQSLLPRPPGPGADAIQFAVSDNYIFFSSARADVLGNDGDGVCEPPQEDCNGAPDVFRFDRLRQQLARMSLTCLNEETPEGCAEPAAGGSAQQIAMVCGGTDLVLEDTNGEVDVFLRHQGQQFTYRVSLADSGAESNGPSGALGLGGSASPSLGVSLDSRFIVFASAASNLVSDDDNGAVDVFVHDFALGTTELASRAPDGTPLEGDSGLGALGISGDGRFSVFETAAESGVQVLLYDRQVGATRRVAPPLEGCELEAGATADSWAPAISTDGLVVAFLSTDPCLVGPSDNPHAPGPARVVAWHRLFGVTLELDAPPVGAPDGAADALRLSGDGTRVLFRSTATNLVEPALEGAEPRLFVAATAPDADGDGLPDLWEELGLDYDEDGVLDLDLPGLGALPARRDLFLELDYLVAPGHTHEPGETVIGWMLDAFAAAPVINPDGTTGIALHLDADAIDAIQETAALQTLDGIRELQVVKADWFGSPESRDAPNWDAIRASRALVYRYGLLGHRQRGTSSSGIAELPGDDFLVSLGAFTGQVGTVDEQAGTLLHELGHTLGLHHGGSDDINCKPNYLSLMSYTYQLNDVVPGRPLDYSREALPTLFEDDLDEPLGVGGPPDWVVVWGPPSSFSSRSGPADGPLDWNGNGQATDRGVQVNINYVGNFCFSARADDMLVGHDDWGNLLYNFRGAADSLGGPGASLADSELTAEEQAEIRAASPFGDNLPPTAAADDVSAAEGTRVVLDASRSRDPEGAELVAHWTQTAGAAVELGEIEALRAELRAPEVEGDQRLRFELVVDDGVFRSPPAWVEVLVRDVGFTAGAAAERPHHLPSAQPGVSEADAGRRLGLDAPDVAPILAGEADAGCSCRSASGRADLGWVLGLLGLCVVARSRRLTALRGRT